MKATCEGGIADGRTVEVPDDRERLVVAHPIPWLDGDVNDSKPITVDHYRRRRFLGPGGKVASVFVYEGTS